MPTPSLAHRYVPPFLLVLFHLRFLGVSGVATVVIIIIVVFIVIIVVIIIIIVVISVFVIIVMMISKEGAMAMGGLMGAEKDPIMIQLCLTRRTKAHKI